MPSTVPLPPAQWHAARIGIALQRQGKRRGGRWAYGVLNSQDFGNSDRESLRKVGVILDVAAALDHLAGRD